MNGIDYEAIERRIADRVAERRRVDAAVETERRRFMRLLGSFCLGIGLGLAVVGVLLLTGLMAI